MEPVREVGVSCIIVESAVQIVLQAQLDPRHGYHDAVCRYQARFKTVDVGSEWVELPIQVLWHSQHRSGEQSAKAVSFGTRAARPDYKPKAKAKMKAKPKAGVGEKDDGGMLSVCDPSLDSNQIVDECNAAQPSRLPNIPLVAASSTSAMRPKNCLVVQLREEDGLQLNQSYTFSIRVGDLRHLCDWSEPSKSITLAVPPPVCNPVLNKTEARIQVSDITDTCLTVTWPQFFPAVSAGVPIHAEVEYLLTVAPTLKPLQQWLVGRGAPHELPSEPHTQWLLSSAAPKGSSVENVGRGKHTFSVVVRRLIPHTAYEFILNVRYARLGPREWHESLFVIAQTKKPPAEAQAFSQEEHVLAMGGNNLEDSSVVRWPVQVPLDSSKFENQWSYKDCVPRGLPTNDALPNEIPSLPPIDAPTKPIQDMLDPSVPHENVEEWLEVAQADACRIIGGNAVTRAPVPGAAPDPWLPEFGLHGSDLRPFWRRDPLDLTSAHMGDLWRVSAAMQLGLTAYADPRTGDFQDAVDRKAIAPMVLQPPNSGRISGRIKRPAGIDREAFPRRYIHA